MHPAGSRGTNRANRRWWFALVILLAWQLVGVWPAAPVEGDAEAIAAGAEGLAAGGPGGVERCYRYAGQVAIYALLAGARRFLGVACLPAFAALSAAAALAFVLLGAALVRRLLGVPYAAAGLALLLFQETGTSAFYPNSTIVAAAVLLAACAIASAGETTWTRGAASGAALAVAGLARADVALVAPVLPLLLYRGEARRAAVAAAASVATALALYGAVSAALGAGPLAALHEAVEHMGGRAAVSGEVPGWLGHESVRSLVGFWSPGWLLGAALGGVSLVRRGAWKLLPVALAGTVPLFAAYARNLSSPKYLVYAIPFLALLGLAGLAETARWGRRAATLAVVLLAVHSALGLRVVVRSKPWIAPPGDALVLLGRDFAGGPFSRVELALGGGTIVPTADGPRLASGVAFAPLVWHRAKASTARCQRRLEAVLASADAVPGELFSGSWLAQNATEVALRETGFTPVHRGRLPIPYGARSLWRRGTQTIVHTSCEIYSYEWRERAWALSHATSREVLYVAGGGRERAMMLSYAAARAVCDDDGPTCLALLALDLGHTPGLVAPTAAQPSQGATSLR